MQICKVCGKEIKYIPTMNKDIVICDVEESVFYTITGYARKGYKLHICEEKVNGKKAKEYN